MKQSPDWFGRSLPFGEMTRPLALSVPGLGGCEDPLPVLVTQGNAGVTDIIRIPALGPGDRLQYTG